MTHTTRPPLNFYWNPTPARGKARQISNSYQLRWDHYRCAHPHPHLCIAILTNSNTIGCAPFRKPCLFVYFFSVALQGRGKLQHCALFLPMPARYRGHARCFGTGGSTVPAGLMREKLESVSWKPSERRVNRWTGGQKWMEGI